jgi:hypothetical protein
MKAVKRRPVAAKPVKPGGDIMAWLDAAKAPSRLLKPIERHLLTRRPDFRATDVLHPSEMIGSEWCHRASYHMLRGDKPKPEHNRLRTQTIFEEGHEIHRKWQQWLREMGVLYGQWECLACGWHDMALAPVWCHKCRAKKALVYNEVPLISERHRIAGHADGLVKMEDQPDCLIEIKSIGLGTVRSEAPGLLKKADGDLDKLWDSIRHPFGKHLRQGQLYLSIAQLAYGEDAPQEIVFLYENKTNQAAKEFVVKHDPEVCAELLEDALDVVWAVNNDREPDCTIGDKGCPKCKQFDA